MRVLFFASLREARGRADEPVEVAPGTTAADLYARLFPPGPQGALPVAYARNRAIVPGDTVLADGDELALLPPLGGG